MEIKINGLSIEEYYLKGANNKATIYLINDNIKILKSYNTFICIIYEDSLIISNLDKYNYSRTTKRHYNLFVNQFNINNELLLKENNFLKIIESIFNNNNYENKIKSYGVC